MPTGSEGPLYREQIAILPNGRRPGNPVSCCSTAIDASETSMADDSSRCGDLNLPHGLFDRVE
jgi:hypothetical protein